MAEAMEDDDMILLIVGDKEVPVRDDEKQMYQILMPSPIAIKQESSNDSQDMTAIDEIIEKAAELGQYIQIKQEKEEYEIEYLEEEFPVQFAPVDDWMKHGVGSNAVEKGYAPQFKMKLPTRKYVLGGKQRKSFVQQLRKEHPEMKKNLTLLVEHLAGIMRELKPPTPPTNFCKVVYDEDDNLKFECCTCKAHNDSLASASRHYQEKHGKRYLICFACGADFRNTTNLYKHEKRCASRDARAVLRARGRFLGRKGRGRPFLTRNSYADRAPPAAGKPGRLYCAKCPASFVHKQNLIAHENSHAGLRPFRCDSCPAAYTSEMGLKRHLQTHGADQFICDHCGRIFKMKPALISHLDTHRPLRKFGCSQCSRRFAQKGALQHHVTRQHLRLPPACGCPVCAKRYARMSHVKDHMNKAHGLTMITRKMFFKALPTMPDIEIKEARVVLNSEVNQLTEQTPFIPEEVKPKPKEDRTKKIKESPVRKEIGETTEAYSQNVYKNLQGESNETITQSGSEVYEIVLDNEENAEMMNEFLQYVQLKVEPGEVITLQNCVYET